MKHAMFSMMEFSPIPDAAEVLKAQIRITAKDIRVYGFTPDCPRCTDLRAVKKLSNNHQSDECRLRMYLSWESNNDPKYMAV